MVRIRKEKEGGRGRLGEREGKKRARGWGRRIRRRGRDREGKSPTNSE